MRYFPNKAPDHHQAGAFLETDKARWCDQILQLCDSIMQGMPPAPENCDGGLYVGNAGIAYMFYSLAKNESLKDHRSTLLENAMLYTRVSEDYVKHHGRAQDRASFILGEAGVHAITSLIYEACGSGKEANKYAEKFAAIAKDVLPINFLRCGSDELFVGRSGYLCGVLNLQKGLHRQIIADDLLKQIISVTIQSGQEYVAKKQKTYPLMYAYYNKEYLGAAHGLSSILQMLLSFPSILKSNPAWEGVVKQSVDFLLSLEQNSNYPPAMDEVSHKRPESEELVHWCHGAPGVVYMFARAYKVWGEDKYLQACVRCAELTWHKGLLRKGPGICHGVAGSGYVFLLLYRLTGDQKYLYRAEKFAEFLFSNEFQQARIPDSPYSLYEGWAGAVCFLSDLIQPQHAEFPLFNVFME